MKLDANENPYGPPPEVLKALGSMAFPNIYPDPEQRALRKALAEREGVPIENILGEYTNGTNILMARCLMVLCGDFFGAYR